MLWSIGVILLVIVFSISPLDGRHLEVEENLDLKPEERSFCHCFQDLVDLEKTWSDYKKEFGKTYRDSTEEECRKKLFKKNLKWIARHNERSAKGKVTWTAGINQFTDLGKDEGEHGTKVYCRPPRKRPLWRRTILRRQGIEATHRWPRVQTINEPSLKLSL